MPTQIYGRKNINFFLEITLKIQGTYLVLFYIIFILLAFFNDKETRLKMTCGNI